uniref:Uncharacterized protein n=1 Tax=Anguilla anguilla TaxID=7936 RepID=A0A0E9SXI6_ANGAN
MPTWELSEITGVMLPASLKRYERNSAKVSFLNYEVSAHFNI